MSNGKLLREYTQHKLMAITAIAMGHGIIISGDENGIVRACYFDYFTSQFKCRERKQKDAISSIVISKDESYVLLGTKGGVVNL